MATGQFAHAARADAVDPMGPAAVVRLRPTAPIQSMEAARLACRSMSVGEPCNISTSILTGRSVDSTAMNASRTAISAVASARAASPW